MFLIHQELVLSTPSVEFVDGCRKASYTSEHRSNSSPGVFFLRIRQNLPFGNPLPEGTRAFVDGIGFPSFGPYHLDITAFNLEPNIAASAIGSNPPLLPGTVNVSGAVYGYPQDMRGLLIVEIEKTYQRSSFVGIDLAGFSPHAYSTMNLGAQVHICGRFHRLEKTPDGDEWIIVVKPLVFTTFGPFKIHVTHSQSIPDDERGTYEPYASFNARRSYGGEEDSSVGSYHPRRRHFPRSPFPSPNSIEYDDTVEEGPHRSPAFDLQYSERSSGPNRDAQTTPTISHADNPESSAQEVQGMLGHGYHLLAPPRHDVDQPAAGPSRPAIRFASPEVPAILIPAKRRAGKGAITTEEEEATGEESDIDIRPAKAAKVARWTSPQARQPRS